MISIIGDLIEEDSICVIVWSDFDQKENLWQRLELCENREQQRQIQESQERITECEYKVRLIELDPIALFNLLLLDHITWLYYGAYYIILHHNTDQYYSNKVDDGEDIS